MCLFYSRLVLNTNRDRKFFWIALKKECTMLNCYETGLILKLIIISDWIINKKFCIFQGYCNIWERMCYTLSIEMKKKFCFALKRECTMLNWYKIGLILKLIIMSNWIMNKKFCIFQGYFDIWERMCPTLIIDIAIYFCFALKRECTMLNWYEIGLILKLIIMSNWIMNKKFCIFQGYFDIWERMCPTLIIDIAIYFCFALKRECTILNWYEIGLILKLIIMSKWIMNKKFCISFLTGFISNWKIKK